MIREIREEDKNQVAELYRYYVEHTAVTFEITPPDGEEMWNRALRYEKTAPWYVWEEAGRILGYAYAAPYGVREGFRYTVEISVYIRNKETGKGIGKQLTQKLLSWLREHGYYTVVSRICCPNDPSQRLFESFGFERAGLYPKIGRKAGKWLDLADYILPLRPYDSPEEQDG